MPSSSTSDHTSAHDTLARWMDSRFTIPGTNIKFGLDPIIGLVPGAGDWLSGLISGYFIVLGAQKNVPPAVMMRMGFNVLLDVIVGSIPLLGDLFDVGWKANTKNARLLGKYAADSHKTKQRSKAVLWGVAIGMLALVFGALALIVWVLAELLSAIF